MSERVTGELEVTDAVGVAKLKLDGSKPQITLTDADGNVLIQAGYQGNVRAGGVGKDGDLILKDSQDRQRIHLGGGSGVLELQSTAGANRLVLRENGTATFGGGGSTGRLDIVDGSGTLVATFGAHGNMTLGGDSEDGDLILRDRGGVNRLQMDADSNNLVIRNSSGDTLVELGRNGNLMLGGEGADGDIEVRNDRGELTIQLSGNSGDILLHNADCAEEFDIGSGVSASVAPGMVVVLDADGSLVPCGLPYDTRAAGIVAGAGGYRPAIVLDRRDTGRERVPVAMFGKAFCLVDAGHGPVDAGALLTTSTTPGHAMVASDRSRAVGAIVGKALSALASGRGLIPVLVSAS